MIASSNAPPATTTNQDAIARLQELTNKLTIAIQDLKYHLQSLPGYSEIERLLINLGERHATRTYQLLAHVPNNSDGLLTAVNLVQTYLQVTEFLIQNFYDDVLQVFGQEQGTAIVQTYKDSRQALDTELLDILSALKTSPPPAPPVTVPGTGNPKIEELIKKSQEILDVLNSGSSTSEKVTKFIQYLEENAEPILKSDGFALTEAQSTLLIETWGIAMEKLPSIVPEIEEERKQVVTQFLKIRRLLENNYDLVAEILRLKDPLGFRTP